MAKFAVMANLVLGTPAQQDNLHAGVLGLIKPDATWGETTVQKVQDEQKKPAHVTVVRFNQEADADTLFDYVKARMVLIPVLEGRVTKHLCYHDEANQPCRVIEEFVK